MDAGIKDDDGPVCAECGEPATHWTANGVMSVEWCSAHRHLGDGSPYKGRIRPPKRKPRRKDSRRAL